MSIGDKIRQQRRILGMKQEELSKQVGVSLKTVQRWESGERSPRMEEMDKLAEVLNVPSYYFMRVDNDFFGKEHLIPTKENTTQERNTNIAVITLENGKKVEAPATPEGYAFLKEVFAMSLAGTAVATA